MALVNAAIAVKAFIVKDDQMLVLKRRPDDIHKPGEWDIPGGRLDAGEDPFKGLQREVTEETNLKIQITQPLSVQHFTRDDGQIITMIIFVCSPVTKAIVLSPEHTEYQWIAIDQAEGTLSSWLIDIIQSYRSLRITPT